VTSPGYPVALERQRRFCCGNPDCGIIPIEIEGTNNGEITGEKAMSSLPPPKDPISIGVEKGIEEAAKMARDYLDKLVAPALEEGGGIIGDTVAYWRFKNKVNLVLKAKAFLESKGIEPKQLLPKVVAPFSRQVHWRKTTT
jgi:hypothetical protein